MAKTATKGTKTNNRVDELLGKPGDSAMSQALARESERVPKFVDRLEENFTVQAPRMRYLRVRLIGESAYMMLRFSQKTIAQMREKHEQGTTAGSKKVREKRDFNEDYEQAKHLFQDQKTVGICASSIRNAMISACRIAGFVMTKARLGLFVEEEGTDYVDDVPLIRIYGTPEMSIMPVRNATGVADLRSRAKWREWHVDATIRFDYSQFNGRDIFNLLQIVGKQVGLGEGRPDSKNSAGMGFGLFRVALLDDKGNVVEVEEPKGSQQPAGATAGDASDN